MKETVTLVEVREQKRKLEQAIRDAINAFQDAVGIVPEIDIEFLNTMMYTDHGQRAEPRVTVRAEVV